MPDQAHHRVAAGQAMPGVFVANDRMPARQLIDQLQLIEECSAQSEWSGLVLYLPL
jgi:hypothetical protein